MKYRTLGSTGINVSEIGFGTWGIGGVTEGASSYGPTDDNDSRKALKRAFDLGVNFYDTANIYGNGHSEELLGQVFKDVREKIIIATKVGFLSHNGLKDFSSSNLVKSLEGSLIRLQTDYVDLYQLHDPPVSVFENKEVLQTLERLKSEGKIRFYGISVHHPDDGIVFLKKYGIKSIQVNFSMTDQRIVKNDLLGRAKFYGTGLIGRTPLNFGFLTGKYLPGSFDPRDHRSRWSGEQQQVWAKSSNLFLEMADSEMNTLVQLALRYCLSYLSISVTIPGMLTVKQVEEDVRASDLGPLNVKLTKTIEIIYNNNTFFVPQ